MSLDQLAHQVGQQLKAKHAKLATAESCTGGGLSYWITSVAGSSDWFDRGFVTYTNAAKIDLLGVAPDTLQRFGAVSSAVAKEMAEGALKKSEATISIAITGIAGPGGGSLEKPVGLVFIAWAGNAFPTDAMQMIFSGERDAVRSQSIVTAMEKICSLTA